MLGTKLQKLFSGRMSAIKMATVAAVAATALLAVQPPKAEAHWAVRVGVGFGGCGWGGGVGWYHPFCYHPYYWHPYYYQPCYVPPPVVYSQPVYVPPPVVYQQPVYQPPVTYTAPQVVTAPAPVTYTPAPVYTPPPVVYSPPVVYVPPYACTIGLPRVGLGFVYHHKSCSRPLQLV